MSSSDVDYAHTAAAEVNRDRKATALAAAARELGLCADDVAVGGGHRRQVRRAAGITREPSEETWHCVAVLLGLDPGGGGERDE